MTAKEPDTGQQSGDATLHSSRLLGAVLALRQAAKSGEEVVALGRANAATWPNAEGLQDYGRRISKRAVEVETLLVGEAEKIPERYNASTQAMAAMETYVALLRRSSNRLMTYSRRPEVSGAGGQRLRDLARRLLEYATTAAKLSGLIEADGLRAPDR